MSEINISTITKNTVDKLVNNMKRNYYIKNEDILRRYKTQSIEEDTQNKKINNDNQTNNLSTNSFSRNENINHKHFSKTINSDFIHNEIKKDNNDASYDKINSRSDTDLKIVEPNIEKFEIELCTNYSDKEKQLLENKVKELSSDNIHLNKENIFLQKKITDIQNMFDQENVIFKQEYADIKKKSSELERFKELFIYFIQKCNLEKYMNNYTNEGYNFLEVKLLQLECYIQDLKNEIKILAENSNIRNEISQKLIFDLKNENTELRNKGSILEQKTINSDDFISLQDHKCIVERLDSTIKDLNKSNKILKEKLEHHQLELSPKDNKETRRKEFPNNNFGVPIETKIIQSLKKDGMDKPEKQVSKITPYHVQRNNRKNQEKKIVMGKEIIIENPINSENSPKFYQDTKEKTITFNNNEDDKGKPHKYKGEGENSNLQKLEKRLDVIEKDIGYFKKNIPSDITKDSDYSLKRSYSNSLINTSKSIRSTSQITKTNSLIKNKSPSHTNHLSNTVTRNRSSNLVRDYKTNTYNYNKDTKKDKMMESYLKSLNHIEREINEIKKK